MLNRRDVLKAGLFAPLLAVLGVKGKPKGIFSQEFLDEKPSLGGDLDAGYVNIHESEGPIQNLVVHDGELYFSKPDGIFKLTGEPDGRKRNN